MRKILVFVSALLAFLTLFTSAQAAIRYLPCVPQASEQLPKEVLTADVTAVSGIMELPASLLYIDDSAFEGTAASAVSLPAGLESIGERAFADMENLRSISIPNSVHAIGSDAFSGTEGLTVFGTLGSFAHDWAMHNGFGFEPLVVLMTGNGCRVEENTQQSGRVPAGMEPPIVDRTDQPKTRDTGRLIGEINQEICTGRASMLVMDRYFP